MHIFERLLGGKEYAISKFLLLHIFERLLGFVQRIFFFVFSPFNFVYITSFYYYYAIFHIKAANASSLHSHKF